MTSTFVSDLIRDYLADADSIAAGVPADTVLKKQSISDVKLSRPPRLLVAVDPDGEKKHAKKVVFQLDLIITAELSADVRSTTEGWMKAIRERMDDHDALAAWIDENRTEQQRAGWQVAKLRMFASDQDFTPEGEGNLYSVALSGRMTVFLD